MEELKIQIKKLNIILLILLSLMMIGAVSAASDANATAISSDVSDTHITHTDANTQVDKTNSNNNNANINEDITTDEKSSTNTKIKTENTKLSATRNYKLKENEETSFKSLNKTIYDNINTGTYTIDLKSNYTYQTNDGEDLKKGITIDGTKLQGQTLTINGNGHTINGSNEARIFKVTNGAQLKLINITLTQGKGQNDGQYGDNVGGAIYANNAKITMANCTLTQNNAEVGGAIHTENSQVNITGNTITNNTAEFFGGAIYTHNSQLNITGNTITGNTETNNYGNGGAIYTLESQLNITGNNITGNNATGYGGAIYTLESQLNITGNTITGNNANNEGGAIYTYSSQLNITGNTITNNTATGYGGAIYTYYNDIVNIIGNLFMDNTANNDGSAIYGEDFDNLTVNGNIFLNKTGSQIIYLKKGSTVVFGYDLGCNWFGNNASNYKDLIKDDIVGISGATLKFDSWLFLTANSTPVTALSGGNVTFKLSLYNSSKSENNVSDFDNGLLYPVDLTVSYVNGTGDESVRLGGNVAFKPDTVGIGSVTANISNVGYTIGLTIDKEVYGTEITDLSFNDLFEGKPVTVNGTLKYNGTNFLANQKINVTISNNTYIISQYGYTDSNGKFSITLTPAINGNVNITATYQGNDTDTKITYNATNATTRSNIVKVTYNITFDKLEPSYDYNTTVTITGNVTTNYKELDVTNITITLNNGNKEVVNLINGNFTYTFQGTIGGLNNITVTCKDATNTTQAFIKYPTKFTINNIPDFTEGSSIDLIVNEKNKYTGQVTVTIGTETYNIDIINGAGKLTITPKLSQGTYTATIKFAGNENYTEANASSNSFKINAKPVPPSPEPVTKQNTKIIAKNKIYKLAKYKTYAVTVKNKKGKPVKNTRVKLRIGKKTYTAKTNKKGVATFKIPNKKSKKKSNKKSYKITATLNKNTKNDKLILKRGSKTNKATTNKQGIATFKIKKTTKKIRKYTITLKTTNGQVVQKQKVTLKINKKTFKAKTNSKGKATFKINNLNKNGKYKGKLTYNGNNNYNKSSKTVKLTVKE